MLETFDHNARMAVPGFNETTDFRGLHHSEPAIGYI